MTTQEQTIPVCLPAETKVKEGYKLTEMGIVPADWEVKKLGDIGEVMMCKRVFNYQTQEKGKIPFYKIGTFGKKADAYIPEDLYNIYMQKFSFPKKGDILISAAGTIGRTIVYDGRPAYFQDSNIVWIDNNEKLITNNYLFYVFKIIKYNTEGGTIQRLYNNILKSAFFSRPTLAEQTRIATVLSDMDELITKLDELIEKKKAIKQGAMQVLLTPKEDWEVKKLGEICELQNGYSFKSSTYTPNGKYLIVTIANVQDGYMDTSECNKIIELPKDIQGHQKLNLGDLLISMTGNVGRVCKVDIRNTLLNQRVGRLNPTNIEVSFLYYLLNDRKFIKQMIIIAQGGAQCNLSKKDIDNYEANIPTSREEQTRIATILSDMDNDIQQLEQKKAKYDQIKQGAMQQLLTGKIRLK